MSPLNTIPLFTLLLFVACHSPVQQAMEEEEADEPAFAMQETLAAGDTGMAQLAAGFTKTDRLVKLCQHWELENMEGVSSVELVMDENNVRIFPQLNIFKDSSVVENARNNSMRIGRWSLPSPDTLLLQFPGNQQKKYELRNVTSRNLYLVSRGKEGQPLYLRLSSDGLVHKNPYNDPFHPVNVQWRIPPRKPESDSAIHARVLGCLKFYALYFRDNIKRQKTRISFLGLPTIFQWYSRGIGLPEKEALHETWVHCFYNRRQAEKGYEMLRRLIVDYEFNWPDGAPVWVYETHSVLEQMYHKLDAIGKAAP